MALVEKSRVLPPPPDELLSVGDIVGRGIRTARRNWRLFLDLFTLPSIVFGMFATVFTWAIGAIVDLPNVSDWRMLSFPLSMSLITVVTGFCAAWLVSQRTVQIARMALVEGTGAESANSYVQAHRWKAFLLYFGGIFAGFCVLVLAIAAILKFGRTYNVLNISAIVILAAFAQLWLYQFWAISLSVLAVEETAWRAIFQRSAELTKVSLLRTFNYVLLLGVAMYFLNIVINAPLMVLVLIDSALKTQTITAPDMPLWVRVLDALLSGLRLLVLTPCAVLCNAFYYNDLRLRCDGWDLVKRLEALAQLDRAAGETNSSTSLPIEHQP